MIPRRVELENFLSFGGRQAVAFDDGEALWVLCGPNGVGKSAVFDAMTFALFGQHRGGGVNADELIRHGANGFAVVFEFEFNRTVYAVERGRARRVPVQRVRRKAGEEWEDIDLTAYPGRDRIRGWAEATLGLKYEAFTASVMLRQGEADKILTAAPRDRLEFLRQIIGAERYERLHDRVNAAARHLRAKLDAVTAERDRIPDVSAEQLDEAAAAHRQTADQLGAARQARDAAVVRVEQARRWNELTAQERDNDRLLREADARAADAGQIRHDHERFEELGRALPLASELIGLRNGLKQLDADLARLTGELQSTTTARDEATRSAEAAKQQAAELGRKAEADRTEAKRLRETADRTRPLVALAEGVEQLAARFGTFPETLDADHAAAAAEVTRFATEKQAAGERRAAAAGLLKAAEARRKDFDTVEVGAKCSRCGLPVSEEHARRERADLGTAVAEHRHERDEAQAAESAADRALKAATTERDRLAGEVRERDRVRDRLQLQRQNLAAHGVTADAATLRAGIEEQVRQAEALERATTDLKREQQAAETRAAEHEGNRVTHERRATALTGQLDAARTRHTRDTSRRDALLDQLPAGWRGRVPTLTPDDLAADRDDFDRLDRSGIASRFRLLSEDAARRGEWVRRRDQLRRDIEQVPDAARCAVADAEQAARDASTALTAAEAACAAARDREAQLTRDSRRRAELDEQHRTLTRDHRLHDTLAGHLGPQGLQRDLVRAAEREIVRHADRTLRTLSRDDLTIELDDAEGGPDRAFALRVRRADDPTPINVVFLSGSQKFRVAVAVALAIGRFASGQARPLESVIIDEGFGSLDRDGLLAMGDELRNVQQSQALRRLILVSHQEDFTAGFPVGYRLERGDGGTTAVRFRREGGAEV
jgi:DNA repair exonuclease SbcCD ATPase subunit